MNSLSDLPDSSNTPRPIDIPAAIAALAHGARAEHVAESAGTTPVGLVCAGIRWLADHCDELTNEQHAHICRVLADVLEPR